MLWTAALFASPAGANTYLFTATGSVCTETSPCTKAGQFGILTDGAADLQATGDTIKGRVGVASGSTVTANTASITGPVDFSDPLTTTSGGYSVPSGSTITGSTLTKGTARKATLVSNATAEWQAISDYWSAQSGSALPANLGKGTNTLTVSGGGAHVYTAGYSVSSTHKITIAGGTDDLVIINVPAAYTFALGAGMVLSGGITADQVLINVLGSANTALAITAGTQAVWADFLVRSGGYAANSGVIHGRVLGGTGTLSLQADLTAPANIQPAPEPSSWMLMAGGFAAFLILAARARERRQRQPFALPRGSDRFTV